MENIFEIKFSFEQYVKDNVILKFSNKQGGAYNVFSYHWQCFVWAAVVGFVTPMVLAFGAGEAVATQVAGIIMAGGTLIAYIIGEGLTDAANSSSESGE